MRKVGITFDPPDSPLNMFNNGIRQNALFFNELLLNIGYDSYLIVSDSKIDKVDSLYGSNGDRYKFTKMSEIVDSKFDVVFQFGVDISVDILLKLRGVSKLIQYNCGNEYIYDTEHALFGKGTKSNQYTTLSEYHPIFDQIWSIPQMSNTNLYYWKTLYRCESIEVPFIWSPLAINQYENDYINSGLGNLKYRNKGESKSLAIFEPNLNVFKWSFPALLVCENAYRIIPNKILHTFVTNTVGKFNIDFFNDIVKPLDIYKDKKMSIESRYNTLYFMATHADVAVSHQWENPLNYLYLDLAWMGWPIVHNAHLCKDVGYYYDGFNYEEGGNILLDVINNHDKNADEYLKRNREVIDRYLPTNKKLQDSYKVLIDNLFI
jgi:hypothetical protein